MPYYHFIIFDIIDLQRNSSRIRKLDFTNIYLQHIPTKKEEFYGFTFRYSKIYKFVFLEFDKYINANIVEENYKNNDFVYGYRKIFDYVSYHREFYYEILRKFSHFKKENHNLILVDHVINNAKELLSRSPGYSPTISVNQKDFLEKLFTFVDKNDFKNQVFPKIFIGKSKYITMDTDVFQPKEKWEDGLISTITSKTDYTLTGWFIVQSIKVLEVIRYLKIHFPNDYLFIKDPKTYDDVASIIKNGYNKTDDSHGIIFLLTKEFPDIHSIIRELNEGIIFYKCEPIFLTNPHIVVFSNFVPIVYSKDILEYYTDIQTLNEETSTLEKSSFKLEENLI